MNRNQLKYLAVFAMLIDHIAWAFVPTTSLLGQVMHFFGRLTAPTMAFFIAEGYCHTRNIRKYVMRMGIFALLSWIPFVYFEWGCLPLCRINGRLMFIPAFGVIYTLFLGLLAIWLWDQKRCPLWCKLLGVAALCVLSSVGDWAYFAVLWCLFFFIYRDDPKKKWLMFSIVGLVCCAPMLWETPWWRYCFMLGIFLAPPLIQLGYQGKPGGKSTFHKWFFYVFYPLHLLVLGLLKWQIF